jgi:predicted RNase H-like nuclease (RuvC/YqgF family)
MEEKIPLISASKAPVSVRGRTGNVRREEFEKAVLEWKKDKEIFETQKKASMIESIVKEYKSEREVEARKRG